MAVDTVGQHPKGVATMAVDDPEICDEIFDTTVDLGKRFACLYSLEDKRPKSLQVVDQAFVLVVWTARKTVSDVGGVSIDDRRHIENDRHASFETSVRRKELARRTKTPEPGPVAKPSKGLVKELAHVFALEPFT